jgi:hypothetical protein
MDSESTDIDGFTLIGDVSVTCQCRPCADRHTNIVTLILNITIHSSVPYQCRVSTVSVTCQCRPCGVRHRNIITRILNITIHSSVPYQCRVSTVSVPYVRCPTHKHRHMYFKQNDPHISGALNGRYWYGTDTSLTSANRPFRVDLRGHKPFGGLPPPWSDGGITTEND